MLGENIGACDATFVGEADVCCCWWRKNALSLAAAGENAPPLSRRGGVGDGDGVGGRRGRRITR